MKEIVFLLVTFIGVTAIGQKTHNGLPVIKCVENKADYRIGNEWKKGSWGINAALSPDVLELLVGNSKVPFAFYTDVDSISFDVDRSTAKQFYVLTKDGQYALTEVKALPTYSIDFAKNTAKENYAFLYEDNRNNDYLNKLRNQYKLAEVVAGSKDEMEKALKLLNWVHNQWKHNGNNEPKKSDAISILEEVKEGKNFRCVEYGIVTTACLNSVGLPARVLGLKTKDVETTESGAGHVLLEVYLKDLNKWVLMDGQWDVMPVLNKVPLNAVEFQDAIATNYDQLEIQSLSGTGKRSYTSWIFPYLYFFDVKFDNREGLDLKRQNYNGKSSLMLVPKGAKEPTVFQRKYPIGNVVYTNDLSAFYAPPLVN